MGKSETRQLFRLNFLNKIESQHLATVEWQVSRAIYIGGGSGGVVSSLFREDE